jgi:hypothetical protein
MRSQPPKSAAEADPRAHARTPGGLCPLRTGGPAQMLPGGPVHPVNDPLRASHPLCTLKFVGGLHNAARLARADLTRYTHMQGCVGWRQTGMCDPEEGPRQPDDDLDCDRNVPYDSSGYCECLASGGQGSRGSDGRVVRVGKVACGHRSFSCDAVCAAGGLPSTQPVQFRDCRGDCCTPAHTNSTVHSTWV